MRRAKAFRRVAAPALAGALIALLGTALITDRRRGIFLSGPTSDRHHLVEASCDSCHELFGGAPNDRCASCHRAELVSDSHPPELFADPRWAAELAVLDARRCITCHREHRLAPRNVTVQEDFCVVCHGDVTRERESHRGFTPASCGQAACHNYHDNSVLRSEILAVHLREADLQGKGAPVRALAAVASGSAGRALALPTGLAAPPEVVAAWRRSAHARADVTCATCHQRSSRLVERPGLTVCRSCHGFAAETYLAGQHGVRAGLGLPPLEREDARLAMRPPTRAGQLFPPGCATCHDAHSVNTARAATEACLGCHADSHSQSFAASPHAAAGAPRSGDFYADRRRVTCATCHLPRVEIRRDGRRRVAVNHNNSFTMAPVDRMATVVCTSCHSLELSLATLLDESLVERNFAGQPARGLRTFRMMEALAAAHTQGAAP